MYYNYLCINYVHTSVILKSTFIFILQWLIWANYLTGFLLFTFLRLFSSAVTSRSYSSASFISGSAACVIAIFWVHGYSIYLLHDSYNRMCMWDVLVAIAWNGTALLPFCHALTSNHINNQVVLSCQWPLQEQEFYSWLLPKINDGGWDLLVCCFP